MGAELVDVIIPELLLTRVAHALTIHVEMASNMDRYDCDHRPDFSLRTRLMLANVRAMRSTDYILAQTHAHPRYAQLPVRLNQCGCDRDTHYPGYSAAN